ncbi:MAG: DUF1177 domain-containing protein [Caldisericum sp.]|jgi:hypothetical protein|uniref:DUF1177 domain-containing protein n=1 Tax=Caldisericum sp. TaxID=2499687 RepID=UPI003D0B696F
MLSQIMEIYELLDDAMIDGIKVKEFLFNRGLDNVIVKRIGDSKKYTDFIKIIIPGSDGKFNNKTFPTLEVIGRLGGIGARPYRIGLVSDADGAIVALSVALKLSDMKRKGDQLKGDVIIATHICPNAPIIPHEPVPFMGSPVDMEVMNENEVDKIADAILSVDTTKGNKIIKWNGFAITPTVKEGWILKVSDDLLRIMEQVTGKTPRVLPITMQDITPYGNGISHINSIMQPSTATSAPVVGVAITSETVVPGSATGANRIIDMEEAGRFIIEVAKEFTSNNLKFYDVNEFKNLVNIYGSMIHLQKNGVKQK